MPDNPPVTLTVTAVQNDTTQAVTITMPSPPTPPIPIPVPPRTAYPLGPATFQVPVILNVTTTPPSASNAVTITIGSGNSFYLWTDDTGIAYIGTATSYESIDRLSLPDRINMVISSDETAGDITGTGIVPIYTINF